MDETPTKLFLETSLPTSASPYPSPSSAFYPPPIPASHEFANKLAGNKRYRGSGGAASATAGMASPNGTSLTTPSSANSSRRGSASAPSPLATHQPLVAHLDGVLSASEPSVNGSRLSGSSLSAAALSPSTPTPTSKSGSNLNGDSTALHDRIQPTVAATTSTSESASTPGIPEQPINSIRPSTSDPPLEIPPPSTPPRSTPILTTTTTTSPSPASKRTSQILEILTPTRAAPPSPGPSRRGSLIRRGSSRRWSTTNSATAGTPGIAPAAVDDGYFGNAQYVPDTPTDAAAVPTLMATSKRASRRLSAFNPLASTMEGQVASFTEISTTGGITPSMPTPASITKTDEAEGDANVEVESTGASPCRPILVADFAFPEDDPRFSKRPLTLLTRAERAALGPEGNIDTGAREDEEGDDDDDDEWGWLSRPRPRIGGGGAEEDGEEEEMTPRFGYSYGDPSTPSTLLNGYEPDSTAGGGGGSAADGLDPDSPLPPGIYRALYAFEAEGTAEMSLAEGQLVRVVGRGGGVGWAVVERGWRPENSGASGAAGAGPQADDARTGGMLDEDGGVGGLASEESIGALGMAGQALVPEGYLDIWMLDGEEWDRDDQ